MTPLMAQAMEEARKRSLYFGTTERPGGLPNFQPIITPAEQLARQEAVIAAIRGGAHEIWEITQACGFDAFTALSRVVREGRVTRVRQKKNGRCWHEVAE